jgi:arylsulfatase A-like enzyme
MTSRMPSAHGARSNGIPLPLESVTFADLLAEAGYRTALIGKSHLQNMEDAAAGAAACAATWPGTQPSQRYPEARRSTAPDRLPTNRNCDRAGLIPSTGSRCRITASRTWSCATTTPTSASATGCAGCRRSIPSWRSASGANTAARSRRYVAPQAWRTNLDEFTYPTHYIAEQTRSGSATMSRSADQPFAVMCSFPDPHHPWTPPGRYWDMYDPASIEVPASMSRRRAGAACALADGRA